MQNKKYTRKLVENALEYWKRRLNESQDEILSEENLAITMLNLEAILDAFDKSDENHLHAQVFQMKTVVDEYQKILDDLYGKF